MKVLYNNGTVGECAPEEELHILRHSCAHVMAQAIQRLYPDADFAYGPATERGFYYDVDFGDRKITDEDLAISRVVRMVKEQKVTAITGRDIPLQADSVCVHGDGPKALAFVTRIREELAKEGVQILPLKDIV